ncbi:uncharacterized protein Bfra_001228 [Botrytis fragariae]|uniref:Uncharacterized protein n=1 Tax=Botrytis fragariae TaxID=1964551 RepID=A0A8H6ELR3_9HELO|nr:uncharacterized protein Bfra_001228 [Botrytis fragariae]KAF5876873.1 hypothetical protein Bfra_001228 [Botrytis fragariae]
MFKRSRNYVPQRFIGSLLGGSKLSVYVRLRNNEEALKAGTNYSSPGNQPWEELLRDLIAAHVHLHETGHRGLTLLQRILSNSVLDLGINNKGRQIFDWIKILRSSGIDLEQYGNKEEPIFKVQKRSNFRSLIFESHINRVDAWNFGGSEKSVITYEVGLSSSVGFKYGSRVED